MKELTGAAAKVSAGTVVSRILGYLRDMLVAQFFGAGVFADAFYAAYRIPNLIRRLLGEGSVSAAVIPVLSAVRAESGDEEAQKLLTILFTLLVIILGAVTAAGVIFARELVSLIAYGFAESPEKLNLTIALTRLMFPFVFFVSMAALAAGYLNTYGIFFAPAVAPAALSVSEIGFILALAPLLSPDNQIKGLAISVIIGGAGQLAYQIPAIIKLGVKFRPCFSFGHPGVKKIAALMAPATIGISVDQVNSFVDTMCASFLPLGSVTALYYSNRLMQLPLAIFAIALSTAALPAMSKAAADGNPQALKETLNYSLRMMFFAIVPSTVGLMVFGLPIIKLLFERGRFDAGASLMTYSALAFYAFGLPAYSAVKIFASAFYARKETAVPVKVAAFSMTINAALNILLMQRFAVGGLAMATAISSAFNAFWLFIILRRQIGPLGARKIARTLGKTAVAAAAMCLASYCVFLVVPGAVNGSIYAFAAIAVGTAAYAAAAKALGMEELDDLVLIITDKINRVTGRVNSGR
ncbi:MAG: murein biosynthesis integral membrane protein MurJ [Elusimicrobia bacterium HGW-Elusimicrobia-1]|jgi:putative peptidoglycan lipid II flippase|nr:MAG: murein biosynthesis integral membrane protein MurJ [Elusimicrobia bacterium HGW-Elusimicrobia-1]